MEQLTAFVMLVSCGNQNDLPGFPSSYFVPPSFWKKSGAVHPDLLHSRIGYYQRLITHYGLNLYCAACRQLALLTTKYPGAADAIDAHSRLLLSGTSEETGSIRAWSDEAGNWKYGDKKTSLNRSTNSSYFFSAISNRFLLSDPLTGFDHFPDELGGDRFEWVFYDPFLGENTWATLIAPLQILYQKLSGAEVSPGEYPAELKIALSVLPAVKAMQSKNGGVYARPAAHGQSQEQLVSNETNLTLYAGLLLLQQIAPQQATAAGADELSEQLVNYFRSSLFGFVNEQLRMHTCGSYQGDEFFPGKGANGEPALFATDVHTWGMSILGVDEIDSQFGTGTCFGLWQQVKRNTGFFPSADGAIRGTGYSTDAGGNPQHHICSPEWTFGAINMCRILAAEYELPGPHHSPQLAHQLRDDEKNMLDGVRRFESASALPVKARSYPYVNTWCDTGFGWHAFPVESLCATSWAIMVFNQFNPFRPGGEYLSSCKKRLNNSENKKHEYTSR